MMKKLITALLFVLIIAPAMAAVTVTWQLPATGSTYNNMPSNVEVVDLNFTVADNNSAKNDQNFSIYYYSANVGPSGKVAILADANLTYRRLNPTTAINCSGSAASTKCKVRWTMPTNANMPDGTYIVDVNAINWFTGSQTIYVLDDNANIVIQVNTRIATAQTTRDLMEIVGTILAAIVLIGGLASIAILKTDPAKTAILTVVSAITVAIAAVIIGQVLAGL